MEKRAKEQLIILNVRDTSCLFYNDYSSFHTNKIRLKFIIIIILKWRRNIFTVQNVWIAQHSIDGFVFSYA